MEPTVFPATNFNVAEDCEALRGAMSGLGTSEDVIIGILANRSSSQRQEIANHFETDLGRDFNEDLASELGGLFKDLVTGLVLPLMEYLSKHLKTAMSGMGTNEDTLIEIVCTKNNHEILELAKTYEQLYSRPLAEHMCSETSGDLRRLLTLIVTGVRDASDAVNPARAREQAEELYAAGEGQFGTEECVFSRILAHENFNQLKQIFEYYKEVSGNTIEQALQHEIDGNYLIALRTIVEYVQSPPTYYAQRLHAAMSGAGTDDATLIRIVASRSEIDLGNIKVEFERLYNKTLRSMITQGETRGDYRKLLLAVLH